jgi:hypothetical protein
MRRDRSSDYSQRSFGLISGRSGEKRKSKKRKGKGLDMPLVNVEEEFEYYTSQDEHGMKVQKLRRKKSRGKNANTTTRKKSPRRAKSRQ